MLTLRALWPATNTQVGVECSGPRPSLCRALAGCSAQLPKRFQIGFIRQYAFTRLSSLRRRVASQGTFPYWVATVIGLGGVGFGALRGWLTAKTTVQGQLSSVGALPWGPICTPACQTILR